MKQIKNWFNIGVMICGLWLCLSFIGFLLNLWDDYHPGFFKDNLTIMYAFFLSIKYLGIIGYNICMVSGVLFIMELMDEYDDEGNRIIIKDKGI